tara:strand:+ start:1773 stop:4202 length:2430 start_codon:yes stop_codon:yes gene_type:complete
MSNISRKIYNEVVLQWNEKLNRFDTIFEDSYTHTGDVMEAAKGPSYREKGKKLIADNPRDMGEEDGDEYVKGFEEAFSDLGKAVQKSLKKANQRGMSQLKRDSIKAVAGAGVSIAAQIEEDIGKRSSGIGKKMTGANLMNIQAIGVDIADILEGAMGGLVDSDELAGGWKDFQKRLEKQGVSPEVIAKMKEDFDTAVEGIRLVEIETNLKEGIHEQVEAALEMIPSNAFTKALGIDGMKKQIGEAASEAFIDEGLTESLKEFGKDLGSFARNNFGPILGAAIGIAMAFALLNAISDVTDKIGEKFGATGVQAFQGQLIGAEAAAIRLGYEFDDMTGSVEELSTNFGIAFSDAIGMSTATLDTARALGLSTENSAKLTGMLMTMGGHSASTAESFMKQAHQLSVMEGIAPGVILSDMAESSEDVAKYMKDGGENIAKAAIEARKMGLSLSDAAKISDSLLDFQSSIQSEMEASILLGKQFNFQRARELALAGDVGGAMKEVVAQLGDENEWNKLNSIQREAIADSIGMSVEGMAKMYKEAGKTNAELSLMREMNIDELAGAEAISALTNMKNIFKSIKLQLLGVIGGVLTLGGLITADSPTIVQALSVIVGVLGAMWVGSKLASLGFSMMGGAMTKMVPGLTSIATAGTLATPALFAIGLVGLTVVGILMMIPPIINSVADAIVKMADIGFVGVMGLTLGFTALAAALLALAAAFVFASPALLAITAAGVVGAGIGAMIGMNINDSGGKDSPEGQMRQDIKDMKNAMVALSTGFGVGDGKGGSKPKANKIMEEWKNSLKTLNLKVNPALT